jgi:hypothetical protein
MLTFKLKWTDETKTIEDEFTYDNALDLFYNSYGFLVAREDLKKVLNTKMTPAEKAAVTNPVMVAITGEAVQMTEE